ncbi:MAG TPA: FAD-dependent oxidoreductase [Streptosporangiaceae bacterium]|nr:FAD-dependent oxidoreductase [Streptosporangiaceae bacterium]
MNVDVLIAGGGPAGLAAAIELRRRGIRRVLVADREQQAGGVPRHCAHTGYGLRDLHRLLTGPAYARHYARAAAQAGAQIRASTTVTGWAGPRSAYLTSPAGIETVHARAVLLATGCRERPRAARLVPGGRPPGVLTTGELQQRVYLAGQRLPGRALIIGAEHVSFSALVTLAHAGADVAGLVTEQPRQQSYAAFRAGAALRWRVPVWTHTAISRVDGRDRLAGAELRDLRTGETRFVACQTLVFTGDWIPDHELARSAAGLDTDPGSRGPVVDTAMATSVPGVFAAGNLVHPAETADVAALSGRHAAGQIAAWLALGLDAGLGAGAGAAPDGPEFPGGPAPAGRGRAIPVTVAAPLSWISPGLLRDPGTPPPRGRFVLRSAEYRPRARLEVSQDGRVLARHRARLMPGRSLTLPAGWMSRVSLAGGPVRVLPL